MPLYRLIRHVIYRPGSQETCEVWGIDREAHGIRLRAAPYGTDADDPIREGPCSLLLALKDGDFVTWNRMFEWLSEAEEAGYEVISDLKNLSPYSQILIFRPLSSSS